MNKIKAFFVVFILCGMFGLPPASASGGDVVVSLTIDDPIMEVNGVETEIDQGRGTTPVIVDGRTLVPIRAIIEAYGGKVEWDPVSSMVSLSVEGDIIKLIINNNTAYLNGAPHTLDVSPAIINERTMLPIRFVAEGFNFGVAWDSKTQTVSIIKNTLDPDEYEFIINNVPDYSKQPYVAVNNNIPMFKDYEIIGGSFEYYSDLDALGRCNVCMSSVSYNTMPTEDRGSISSVIPTGWKNASYDIVDGGYVYNRCHLIGFQLTGENANKKNLITGTRYMNVEGMLPFENMVDDYIDLTGNHVMYRATPVFINNNLVADGVLLEAYSVEDDGRGLSFCVYCYNVQPGISINYTTGDNFMEGNYSADNESESAVKVYRTPTGKRYHFDFECGGANSFETTLSAAVNDGLTPCKKCAS